MAIDLFGGRKRQNRRELWQRVARDLGGTFHLPTGFWKPTRERIVVTVDGISINLETYVVQTGNTSQPYTHVVARLARGPGAKLMVSKHGVLTTLGNVFKEDVALGNAQFDRAFVVRCDQPAVARRLVSARIIELLQLRFHDGKLTCDGTSFKLVTPGVWSDEPRLRDGIAIIAELAARDLYGLEALRRVDGGVLGAGDPLGWPQVVVASSVRVVIGAEAHDGQLAMVARTSEGHTADPVELAIVDGSPADTERAGRLPQGAHVAMRRTGTGTLSLSENGLSFRWGDLELDPGRLRAGADLLGAIAAGGETPYR